jgi:hypothetical protein
MSKKHFMALAKALKREMPNEDGKEKNQWRRDVEAVADVCSAMNSAFDYNTFRLACGVNL